MRHDCAIGKALSGGFGIVSCPTRDGNSGTGTKDGTKGTRGGPARCMAIGVCRKKKAWLMSWRTTGRFGHRAEWGDRSDWGFFSEAVGQLVDVQLMRGR